MNRPLSIERRTATEKANRSLRALCRDLANGDSRIGDFDPDIVAEPREVLAQAEPKPHSFAYAGVGSRQTPPGILAAMADIAQTLGDAGTALSTGGASGADKAFETGALRTDAPVTVHTPWPGYNGYRPGAIPRPTSTSSTRNPRRPSRAAPTSTSRGRTTRTGPAAAAAPARCSCATSRSSPARSTTTAKRCPCAP